MEDQPYTVSADRHIYMEEAPLDWHITVYTACLDLSICGHKKLLDP